MIETIISIAGAAASSYSAVSAIATRAFQGRLLDEVQRLNSTVQNLNEKITYLPSSRPISIGGGRVVAPIAPPEALQLLDPVQQSFDQEIISAGLLPTPNALMEQLNRNPWDCLDGVVPVQFNKLDRSSDWAPIMFVHDGTPFVGWQKIGVLRSVFGLEYDGSLNSWSAPTPMLPTVAPGEVPICPFHKVPMKKKVARSGRWAGRMFWGCPKYFSAERCRFTQNYVPGADDPIAG